MDATQHHLLDTCQAWDQLRLVGPHAAPAGRIFVLQHGWAGGVAAAVMVPQRFGMLLEERKQGQLKQAVPMEAVQLGPQVHDVCSRHIKASLGTVTHLSQDPSPQPEIPIP